MPKVFVRRRKILPSSQDKPWDWPWDKMLYLTVGAWGLRPGSSSRITKKTVAWVRQAGLVKGWGLKPRPSLPSLSISLFCCLSQHPAVFSLLFLLGALFFVFLRRGLAGVQELGSCTTYGQIPRGPALPRVHGHNSHLLFLLFCQTKLSTH